MKKSFGHKNSDPVSEMMDILHHAGRTSFTKGNAWEDCLCALVLALEPRCKIFRLLEALPYCNTPLDQIDVLNTFAHLGYFSRTIQTTLENIDSRLLPSLFISEDGKPSVLVDKTPIHLKLYKNGRLHEIERSKVAALRGKVWLFERYDENRPSTSKFMRNGSGHSWFYALLGRFKGTFAQILTAGLILNIIALTTPLYIMLVYDNVIAAGSLNTLPMLTVGVGLAVIFEWALRNIRSRGLSWLAARMDNIVKNRIFAHLVGLAPELVERASVSAQIARIKTFEAVRDFFSGPVFLSMLELPFMIIAAIAIYAVAGPLVFVPLGACFVYGALFYFFHHKVKIAIRLAAKASSARQQFTLETFEKINGVRGYGLCKQWQSRFRDLSGKEMLAHFHLNWLGMTAETIAHAVTLMAVVTTIGYGVHLIWAGLMSTGALVATMILVWRILTPFYSLCTMIPRLEQLRNSIIQVNKLMDLDTEAMEAKTHARLSHIKGQVSFSNTSLRYSDDNDAVFSGLSFDAMPGDLIMITGENGSGKSSVLKMIKALYKPDQGSVQIDGFDIRQLDAPDLRRQIAYVPQELSFFQGTLLENLRFSNPIASELDVEKALRLADVWNEVEALPNGLGHYLTHTGINSLPSSLLPRLSLARAYLHVAPIILIDELPNALLSSNTGKNLKEYLVRNKGKRTVFMVTHREDFMNLADTLIMMRRGQQPLAGTPKILTSTLTQEVAA